MSMEISGNYKDYKNEYLERAQTEQDKVKRTSQEQRAAWVRGVISFLSLSNVPSTSKTNNLYFMASYFMV